jgi:protocatechuate 3,4-dioxygenase beta subunit
MSETFERTMNRRQALAGIGTVSLGALLAACGSEEETTTVDTTSGDAALVEPRGGGNLASLFDDTSSCTLTAEQTEGPFYFDVDKIRSDITEGREGRPLRLALRVRDAESCAGLANAVVDIWHCDAGGAYSGFNEEGTFLRGAQVTDGDGIVEFQTIYPGWYPGRTPHIHAKVHIDSSTALTTQLYFADAVSDAIYADGAPYQSGREATNESDGIFDESLILALSEEDDGYLGTISFDVARA